MTTMNESIPAAAAVDADALLPPVSAEQAEETFAKLHPRVSYDEQRPSARARHIASACSLIRFLLFICPSVNPASVIVAISSQVP